MNASDPADPDISSSTQYGEAEDAILAEKCKHPLHPAHLDVLASPTQPESRAEDGEVEEPPSYCPVCTLHIHQTLIDALWQKWKVLGGPWRSANLSAEVGLKYADTTRAYHKARVDLVNTMYGIEAMAEQEENWELAHPDVDTTSSQNHSATKALEKYIKNLTNPATLTDSKHLTLATPTRVRDTGKSLSYSPDTPQNTNHRPQALWARSYPSHDPNSPHSCRSDDGYWDTSYHNDWHFAVSQCRILLCYYDDEASLDLKYRELNGGSSEFGSENPAVVGLIRHIETWMGTLDDAERERWVQYLNKTADVFLVFNDGEQEGGNSEVSFTHFQPVDSLVGSHVEAYARRIGDIDDEEWEARKAEDENNVDLQFRKEEVTAAVDDHVDLGTEESVDGEDEEMEGESGDEYEENEADKTLTGCI
tara:strand:- start:56616 stop:57878 length:1263 start_codon:yes stop_codon:yes gene_type:complete